MSNSGQTTTTGQNIITEEVAQAFTTGKNGLGYNLDSIELNIRTLPGETANLTVELWSATISGDPDSEVETLSHPTGGLSAGYNAFAAPADTELKSSRTYFVFVKYDGTGDRPFVTRTLSTSVDSGSESEWAIGKRYYRARGSDDAWSSDNKALTIKVNGERVAPAVTSSVCTQDTCNLTFTGTLDIQTSSYPPTSAFRVTAGGDRRSIDSIAVSRSVVSLQGLSPPILKGQTIEVTYTDPSSDDDTAALQSSGDVDVATFTVSPTNDSNYGVPGKPTGVTATVAGPTRIDLSNGPRRRPPTRRSPSTRLTGSLTGPTPIGSP